MVSLAASRRALALIGAASLALAGCGAPTVSRVVGGEVRPHRSISVEAYAAYAIGAVAEAKGEFQEALNAYRTATDADASGVEPWVRRGAMACKLALRDEAMDAFAHAYDNGPTYAPLWLERARCTESLGDLDDAQKSAERGLVCDPDDDDASIVLADVQAKRKSPADAVSTLLGLVLRHETARGLVALRTAAIAAGDASMQLYAEGRLKGLRADEPGPESPVLVRVDGLIQSGDLSGAELLGRRIGLNRSDLAVRAAAMGLFTEASGIAAPIVRADPADADAAIALVASGDAEATALGLDALRGHRFRKPSTLAILLLLERTGIEAGPDARAITGQGVAAAQGDASGDALESALRARVAQRH